MRKLNRVALDATSIKTLTKMQSLVSRSPTPESYSNELWKRKANSKPRTRAFEDVRKSLNIMAGGRKRCMYCEDSLGTDIDHFRPKSLYPDRSFDWNNYLLACSHCNSNEKRAQFPVDGFGAPELIDPSVEDPFAHLAFIPETGLLSAVTPRGAATERIFGLNRREELTTGRADTWSHLERIVAELGDVDDAPIVSQLVEQARRLCFQAIVHHFVRDGLAASPAFVKPHLSSVLKARPALWEWAL